MQFYAITYLKIVPYLSRSILGLGDIEYHTGNYIYALQGKEKSIIRQVDPGKETRVKQKKKNKKKRKRNKNFKREKSITSISPCINGLGFNVKYFSLLFSFTSYIFQGGKIP